MILPSGAYAVIRRLGSHKNDPSCTIHLVDFWRSEADFRAAKPRWRRCDFFGHWPGPHRSVDPNCTPASMLAVTFDNYLNGPTGIGQDDGDDHLLDKCPWSDAPDLHGILAHPSFSAADWKAVPE